MAATQVWDVSSDAGQRSVQHAMLASRRLSLRLTGLQSSSDPLTDIDRSLQSVAASAAARYLDPSLIAISVDAGTVCPRRVWALRRQRLGNGPLIFFLADALMIPGRRDPQRDVTWQSLWSLRHDASVFLAYANWVTSSAPMLFAEKATTVQWPGLLQVPAHSAWTEAELSLADCVNAEGGIAVSRMDQAVSDAMRVADRAHDRRRWPSVQQRQDAMMNRRLAIRLRGVGDLVMRLGWNPAAWSTLSAMDPLMAALKQRLIDTSVALGANRGGLPALTAPVAPSCPAWLSHWHSAAAAPAVGHRNLLVMGVDTVLPAAGRFPFAVADLLPLLSYADACAVSPVSALRHWNFNEFKQFHARAWAVLDRKSDDSLIAETL